MSRLITGYYVDAIFNKYDNIIENNGKKRKKPAGFGEFRLNRVTYDSPKKRYYY